MTKFKAVLYDTILEVRDRKIFYLYWLVLLVTGLIFALIPNFEVEGVDLFETGMITPQMLNEAVSMFFDQFFGFMIFLLVFGSAGLVPAFLNKGRVELAISKPIDRLRLISMKFVSVFIIMCVILALVTTIIWGILSYRLGAASGYFFVGLLYACLQFLTVYALVFLLGVASHSTVVGIMGYFIIRVTTDLLAGREVIYEFLGESVWKNILDGVYHILPKYGEMSHNYGSLMRGDGFTDTYPIFSTLGISVVLFLAALLIFKRRDY